jgi:flagellar basal body-associated protein FliL
VKNHRFLFCLAAAVVTLFVLGLSPARLYAEEQAEKTSKSENGDESSKDKDKEGAENKEGKNSKSDKAEKGMISGGRFAGDPVYVRLQPILLPVINDKGAQQIVTMVIDIQVKDLDIADTIHNQMPRVQDTVLRALYSALSEDSSRNNPMVDIEVIKTRVFNSLDKMLGANVVDDILIQAIAQRML